MWPSWGSISAGRQILLHTYLDTWILDTSLDSSLVPILSELFCCSQGFHCPRQCSHLSGPVSDKLNLDWLIDWMGTVDFFFGRIKETELDDTRYHELTAEQGWSLKMGSPPYTLLCGKNLPTCGDFTCTSSCPVARGEVRWETPNWSLGIVGNIKCDCITTQKTCTSNGKKNAAIFLLRSIDVTLRSFTKWLCLTYRWLRWLCSPCRWPWEWCCWSSCTWKTSAPGWGRPAPWRQHTHAYVSL